MFNSVADSLLDRSELIQVSADRALALAGDASNHETAQAACNRAETLVNKSEKICALAKLIHDYQGCGFDPYNSIGRWNGGAV